MPTVQVLEPPARYLHRYHGQVIEQVLPVAEVRKICRTKGLWQADACSWEAKGKCFIVVPSNGPARDVEAYKRHELAHCNGWPASHPRL